MPSNHRNIKVKLVLLKDVSVSEQPHLLLVHPEQVFLPVSLPLRNKPFSSQ
jgi:hypothetical protein